MLAGTANCIKRHSRGNGNSPRQRLSQFEAPEIGFAPLANCPAAFTYWTVLGEEIQWLSTRQACALFGQVPCEEKSLRQAQQVGKLQFMKMIKIVLFLCVNFAACVSAVTVDRINVTDYGAIPNDGASDNAAINAAVAAGASIYFPPGTYNYTGRITLPTLKSYRLYGDGPGVSIIAFTGPTAGIYASNVGQNTLNVEGLTLRANTTAAGDAISATFTPDSTNKKFHTATIHNVVIDENKRDGTGGYWIRGI